MPIVDCERSKDNSATCNCSYEPCSRKGNCCLCLSYHLSHGELPACFFPEEVERTYNRSQRRFVQLYRGGFRPTMPAVSYDGAQCPRKDENLKTCACTYEPCEIRGICCPCLRSHMSKGELPACACTYEPCEICGICCLCLRSHMSKGELPACVRHLV